MAIVGYKAYRRKDMKTNLYMLLVAAGLLLVGCYNKPTSNSNTDNPEVEVQTLFNHKGCTVNRFHDGGRAHYYTVCERLDVEVTTSNGYFESCGKGCSKTEYQELPTIKR